MQMPKAEYMGEKSGPGTPWWGGGGDFRGILEWMRSDPATTVVRN